MALSSILCFSFFFLILTSPTSADSLGQWTLLMESIGISAMHMQLLKYDRVIIFDRTDFGASQISLPVGQCRDDPNDTTLQHDCTAHSVEYNIANNSVRALTILTDTWCSSGAVNRDGVLVQTGGYNDGDHAVRLFRPCVTCNWQEIPNGLYSHRWYATNQILPDGSVIIIGGQVNTYEFFPKSNGLTIGLFNLTFLEETTNLYPFVYLNVDGNLFIFGYNTAILFNYTSNTVVKSYPTIPDYQPRTYPFTGSSVMLPLNLEALKVEVLVCGGTQWVAGQDANSGHFDEALDTCARMSINDPNPTWTIETMPLARLMGDMILLPNGEVLIINGASKGTAGWELGRAPVLNPVLYQPNNKLGSRFTTLNPTTIPRMYHSTALLLRDGRVLVGGSNPHQYYEFTNVLYSTDLSLEAFSPPYLDSGFSSLLPTITAPAPYTKLHYGQQVVLQFSVSTLVSQSNIEVTMVAPTFTTHSFGMNQRLLVLGSSQLTPVSNSLYKMVVMVPSSSILAPPGFYMLFVVNQGIPSEGIWVQMS